MPSISLQFVPPDNPNLSKLFIWEGTDPLQPFSKIDEIDVIGSYPEYINKYTSQNAIDPVNDWFAIQWQDTQGTVSDLSAPIKGGTSTLVGVLVERVMLRTPDEDENIVLQEAEATVEFIYKTSDPYSVDVNKVDRLWLTELTNLVVVASQYLNVALQASAGVQYTAGMVSQGVTRGDATAVMDALERLERRALRRLGIGGSLIASIKDNLDNGLSLTRTRTTFDSSRLLSTRAIVTESIVVVDAETGAMISNR